MTQQTKHACLGVIEAVPDISAESVTDTYVARRRPLLLARIKVTVYSLYAMAIRSVISTVGQPLRDATARRSRLFGAASDEAAAAGAAAGEGASASMLDGTEGVVGAGGAAAEALAREALEPMPFAYLPSVGAMLLLVAAVAAHVLLLLGKKWSVRFHAW